MTEKEAVTKKSVKLLDNDVIFDSSIATVFASIAVKQYRAKGCCPLAWFSQYRSFIGIYSYLPETALRLVARYVSHRPELLDQAMRSFHN